MTVNELMEVLKQFDGAMPVVTANFEMGFDEIREHRVITLVLNANQYTSGSCGPHDLMQNVEVDGHHVTKALLLGELDPSLATNDKEKCSACASPSE